ncbi:FAD:protein FMN transferase [Luteimonas panaciterrae]|uniref:FAD:protein FMN transferase n=1 Tax=Luteimonas panaciterrae TaxID=363885 RepID=UPI001CF94B37|nr:FAD:protein FMN transferase [Luteimonas panaciterrae]
MLYGETMGTRWRVSAVASTNVDLHLLHHDIQSRLDVVVAQMSTWEADSDICRFNRAPGGTWHVLPQAFFDVLRCALDIAEASGGAYDPTIGPLVGLWGFGANGAGHRIPEAEEIAAARARVGWRRIELRAETLSALQPGGVSLDLSAIAKGYGVDAVVMCLRERGIAAALVDVGGELRGYGHKPDGKAWHVLVESEEESDDDEPCVLVLESGKAVATSGDRWHRFEQDGRRYAHTIDPRSGRPVEHAPASVTVIADTAMQADAWATALTVMGMQDGVAFATRHGLAARFVAHAEGRIDVRATPTFPQPPAA